MDLQKIAAWRKEMADLTLEYERVKRSNKKSGISKEETNKHPVLVRMQELRHLVADEKAKGEGK